MSRTVANELSNIAKKLDEIRIGINAMQDGLDCGRVSGLLAESEVNINSSIMSVLSARKKIEDGERKT